MPVCKIGKIASRVLNEETFANFKPAPANDVLLTLCLNALNRLKATIAKTIKTIKTTIQETINTDPSM